MKEAHNLTSFLQRLNQLLSILQVRKGGSSGNWYFAIQLPNYQLQKGDPTP